LGAAARRAYQDYTSAFDRFALSEGLAAIFEFVAEVNRFLVREEPWKLAKDPSRAADLGAVLRASAESLRSIALWVAPVMPASSRGILAQLGLPAPLTTGAPADWPWHQIPGGLVVTR